jgi:hypothetical protein
MSLVSPGRRPVLALLLAVQFVVSVAAPLPAAAAACNAKSGPHTTALLELYTSEGCSSCPPADRWLSSSFPPGAEANVIPLAFHVDYWDRLGWKDRFAAASWTERQYAAMRANHAGFVYTPQVLLQGRDFEWHGNGVASAFSTAAARPARADIALEATPRQGAVAIAVSARVPGSAERKGATVQVALVDNGLVSEVKAGENSGARLAHDHVVRVLKGGIAVDANGDARGEVVLPLPAEAGKAPMIVAFVQSSANGEVLQALALPLAGACAPQR